MPLFPPQFPHGLTWDRSHAATLKFGVYPPDLQHRFQEDIISTLFWSPIGINLFWTWLLVSLLHGLWYVTPCRLVLEQSTSLVTFKVVLDLPSQGSCDSLGTWCCAASCQSCSSARLHRVVQWSGTGTGTAAQGQARVIRTVPHLASNQSQNLLVQEQSALSYKLPHIKYCAGNGLQNSDVLHKW